MVAAEHERCGAIAKRRQRRLVQALADVRDVRDVFLLLVAWFLGFANGRREVTAIGHLVPEGAKPLRQARDAERGRTHVHAAAATTKIQRNTDEMDGGQG